jgi:hypothetical protein
MLSCAAHFDGSGAGVDFFPAIQVLDEAGQVAATVIGPKVTAGGSADVTFAPFLESPAVASSGGGIQFDTDPQSGGYLVATTTGANGAGKGMIFHATGANPLELLSQSLLLYAEDQGFALGTIEIVNLGDDRLLIQAAGTGDVTIQADPGGVELRSSSLVFVTLSQIGSKLIVTDHLGATIFEVDEDGTILFPAGLPGVAGASGALYQVAGVVNISP